jgi:hypothetical protein
MKYFDLALTAVLGMSVNALGWQHARADAWLQICIKHVAHDDDDFIADFSNGPVILPAGTVFEWAGHAFGPASDPRDESHLDEKSNWRNVSKQETKRRHQLEVDDISTKESPRVSLITLEEVKLTKARPCAKSPAAAALNQKMAWESSPVFGTSEVYYQVFGVLESGELKTTFMDDHDPLDHAVGSGEINGILQGTTDRDIQVPD